MLVNMNINIYTYVVSCAAFGIQIWWMEMISNGKVSRWIALIFALSE